MTNAKPDVGPSSITIAMRNSVSRKSRKWLASVANFRCNCRIRFVGFVFACMMTNPLGTCCGQHLREVVCPFTVHQITDASDPNQLLLVGRHNLARIRFQSDGNYNCDALPVQIDDLQIACAREIDAHRIAVAGTFKHELGFVAMFNSNGQRLWQQLFPAPLVSFAYHENQVFVGDVRGIIFAIELEQGKTLWEKQLHAKMVTALTGFRSGMAVSGDWTGKIVLWNSADGTAVTNFQQHRERISSLLVIESDAAAQRLSLISASRDGTVRLWYPTQNRLVRFVDLRQPVTALVELSGLRLLAATNSGQVHLVDLSTAKTIASIDSQLDYIAGIKVSGEDFFVVSGEGANHLIKLPK